jgi:uncharacterized HAD superfamily protein
MEQQTCIIDIDGVLNYYPDTYVDFVNEQLQASYSSLHEIKDNIPYSQYKTLKRQYRESGYKEDLKVRDWAYELLKYIKSKGYYIIILTARPIDEVNSLVMQTTNWLKKNNLEYDYLTFEKDKDLEIIKKFKNIKFAIDDNRHLANNIAAQGYKVFLINNQYNEGRTFSSIKRVDSLNEIAKHLEEEL